MNYNLEVKIRADGDKKKLSSGSPLNWEAMRQWSHNHPGFEIWFIKEVVRAGVFTVRNADDTQDLRCVPVVGTQIDGEVGDAVVVGFYEGRRDDPWIWANQGVAGLQPELPPEPLPLTYDWVCWHSDFARSRSWTTASFDLDTAAQRSALNGSQVVVRYEDREGSGYGNHSAMSSTTVFSETFGFYASRFVPTLLSDQSVDYDFYTTLSLARVGGWLYLAVQTSYEFYDEELDETSFITGLHVWRFNADHFFIGAPISHMALNWYAYCGSLPIVDRTDLIITQHPKPPGDPGPYGPIAYRVTAMVWDEENLRVNAIFLNGETGAEILNVGEPWVLGAVNGQTSDSVRSSFKRSRTFCKNNFVWVNGDNGTVSCIGISIDGVGSVWDSDDLGWHDPEHSNYCGQVEILGPPLDDRLLIAYSGVIETEIVDDELRSDGPLTFGDPYSSPVTRRKAGLSSKSGTLSVIATTGVRVAMVERTIDGETDDGSTIGPTIDTLFEMLPRGPFAALYNPSDQDEFEYIRLGGWPTQIVRAYRYFWKQGVEWDEDARADLEAHVYNGNVHHPKLPLSEHAWCDLMNDRIDEHKTTTLAEWDELAASRPVTTGPRASFIQADYLQYSAPGWGNDSGVDTWYTALGQLTWTSVDGPLAPFYYDLSQVRFTDIYHGEGAGSPYIPGYDQVWESLDPHYLWDEFEANPASFAAYRVAAGEPTFSYRAPSWAPLSGGTFSWQQKFIWRTIGEAFPCTRTATLPHAVGAGCITTTGLLVCGPHAPYQEYNGVSYEWLPLVWRAYNRNGTIAWTYTHPGTGGLIYCASDVPIAIGEDGLTYTFVQIGTGGGAQYRLIVLDGAGALVEAKVAPTSMLQVMFNGTHFVREEATTTRFGPPL
jgi:hypothetical protein